MRAIVLTLALLASSVSAAAQTPLAERIARYEALYARTGDPSLLWLTAEGHASAGDKTRAIAALETLSHARQDFTPDASRAFDKFRGDPGYEAVRERIRRGLAVARRGRVAFSVDRPDVVPEGVAYDPATRRLFMGDGHRPRVLTIDSRGRSQRFGEALAYPALGMTVDARRGRLWVATTNAFWAEGADKRAEIVGLALRTGAVEARYSHPEARSFNDLTLTPDGDLFVTDTEGGAVFRLPAGALALERVTPVGALNFPNGIAATDDGRSVFIAQGLNLKRLDRPSGEIADVAHPRGFGMLGIDGLYWRDGALIGVQNVGRLGRVVRLRLNPARDAVEAAEVLAAGDPVFDEPTTAALAPDRMYLLASPQLGRLVRPGQLDPARAAKPIVIIELPL